MVDINIPGGFGIPLVNLTTDLLPAKTTAALLALAEEQVIAEAEARAAADGELETALTEKADLVDGIVPDAQLPDIPSTGADIGLGNVDNTSDAAKPVSTLQQTALDGKADVSVQETVEDGRLSESELNNTIATVGDGRYISLADSAIIVRPTGVDDTANIQAALDMPGVTAGRVAVQLLIGEYLTTGLLMKSHGTLAGFKGGRFGVDASVDSRTTVIKLLPNSTGPVITDYNDTVGGVIIRDLTIDGDKDNQTTGYPLIEMKASGTAGDPSWRLDNVLLRNGKGTGLTQGAGRRALHASDLTVFECDGDGIVLNASDNLLEAVTVGFCGGVGIKLAASLQRIISGDVFRNLRGLETTVSGASDISVFGVSFDRNEQEGAYIRGPRTSFVACVFGSNSQAANNTYSHVNTDFPNLTALLSSFVACSFVQDIALTNKAKYAIETNVSVHVIAPNYNTSSSPWVSGFTGSNALALLTVRSQGIADAADLSFGTTNGTKLGTATNQKIGFYGATAIVRPSSTPAAATDLATALTLVNDLRTKLLALGLIG